MYNEGIYILAASRKFLHTFSMHDHWLFIWNVLGHLVASMSGLVSFGVAIYEAFNKKKFETWAFFVIGALCLTVAFDQAWQDEHRNAQLLISEKANAIEEKNFWKEQSYEKDAELRTRDSLLAQNYTSLIGEQATANKSQGSLAQLSSKIADLNAGCYHPDRHLSTQDRTVIFAAAQKAFQEAKKDNPNPTIQFRVFQGDSESVRFWNELSPLFIDAGWKWPETPPPPQTDAQRAEYQKIYEEQRTWLFQHGHMTGIAVFDTKKKNNPGWYISAALSDRKLGNMWPMQNDSADLPYLNGLTIWIGYKEQW
jgi:hypothetical protein